MIHRFPEKLQHFANRFLVLDPGRFLIATHLEYEPQAVEQLLNTLGMRLEKGDLHGNLLGVNHTRQRFWAQSLTDVTEQSLSAMEAREEVDWIGPVYYRPDLEEQEGLRAYLCPLPISLAIRFRQRLSVEELEAFASTHGLSLNEPKSVHLSPFFYFDVDRESSSADILTPYILRERIKAGEPDRVVGVHFETMPMMSPLMLTPNDPIFSSHGVAGRWNLEIIDAPEGWDLSTGSNSVTIAIIDAGCDMTHPDLVFDGPGFNAGTGFANGSPTGPAGNLYHGTSSAGIAAATINNGVGLAGVAGGCQIHAVVIPNGTDLEVLAGINESVNAAGAQVLNLSIGSNTWDPTIVDPAIDNAWDNQGAVICASSGNFHVASVDYPASNPKVIAVGATDQNDLRISASNWGSQYGNALDVVGPGTQCWTTDLQGQAGAWPGDYRGNFGMTSCACPHAAGVAGLIRSLYPALDNSAVRSLLRRSCEKVNPNVYNYTTTPAKPDGPWDDEVGYGRVNVFRALDMGDVYIRDNPSDDGDIPSTGVFWNNSDVLVRQADDDIFLHQPARRDQTNFVYVRIVNRGPAVARNVNVGVRVSPFVSTEFVYPLDWLLLNETHVGPQEISTSFTTLNVSEEAIAKFSLSAEQIDELYGWQTSGWHPCILARVSAANDYFDFTGNRTWASNNAGQRNISIIETNEGQIALFPFRTGHERNRDRSMEIVIDRSSLPRGVILYLDPFDETEYFPRVPSRDSSPPTGIVIEAPTRISISFCGTKGSLTLGDGSRFDCAEPYVEVIDFRGAIWDNYRGRHVLRISADRAAVTIAKLSGQVRQMSLFFNMPGGVDVDRPLSLHVTQRNPRGEVAGGCTAVFARPSD
jgi:hypothetical protein